MSLLQKAKKLPPEFYLSDDVVSLSRLLLGKIIVSTIDDRLTTGMIVETEAYKAPHDRASHAFNLKRTPRNEAMYRMGGSCYVYLCYGIHALFNVVTNVANIPHAILIRAIEPLGGIDIMCERRRFKKAKPSLTAGPGCLTKALGINIKHNNLSLQDELISIQDHKIEIRSDQIIAGPRVGIAYAKEDALLPWRFRIRDNKWTSAPNK